MDAHAQITGHLAIVLKCQIISHMHGNLYASQLGERQTPKKCFI